MGKLDIAILILVGLGGLSCFRKGFTRSVWGLAAILAGVFAAGQFWRALAPILQGVIQHEGIAKWVSIVAIVVGVSIAMDMILERLHKIMDRGVLGWMNHAAGAAFGVVASCFLIGLALLLLDCYGGKPFQDAIAASRFAPPLLEIGNQAFDFCREVVRNQVHKV